MLVINMKTAPASKTPALKVWQWSSLVTNMLLNLVCWAFLIEPPSKHASAMKNVILIYHIMLHNFFFEVLIVAWKHCCSHNWNLLTASKIGLKDSDNLTCYDHLPAYYGWDDSRCPITSIVHTLSKVGASTHWKNLTCQK